MNSLEEYGALFQKLGLTELEVEEGNFKLKLRKENTVAVVSPALSPAGDSPAINGITSGNGEAASNTLSNAQDSKEEQNVPDGEPIKSPLLGIFYAANGDNKAVKEGDQVKEGDILCTIEAMKMMNEVRSTKSGIVSKVCAKEGDLVEYNQTLFVVKAS